MPGAEAIPRARASSTLHGTTACSEGGWGIPDKSTIYRICAEALWGTRPVLLYRYMQLQNKTYLGSIVLRGILY